MRRVDPEEAGLTSLIALGVTLAIQAFVAMAAFATAVLAPEIGRDLGLSPKLVGVFVGIVYVGSMAMSLASGFFLDRVGAIRLSQVCVLLCVIGAVAIAVTPGTSTQSTVTGSSTGVSGSGSGIAR